MTATSAIVWVFDSHTEAEGCISQLQSHHFDLEKMSIVGKDHQTDECVVGFYNVGDRTKIWGQFSTFWGGFGGLLSGAALFVIPGVGPLVVFGPMVGWIAGVLEGAVVIGGMSALGTALFGLGIPKDSIAQYEAALKANKFVVVANGKSADVAKAKEILTAIRWPSPTMHKLANRPFPTGTGQTRFRTERAYGSPRLSGGANRILAAPEPREGSIDPGHSLHPCRPVAASTRQ